MSRNPKWTPLVPDPDPRALVTLVLAYLEMRRVQNVTLGGLASSEGALRRFLAWAGPAGLHSARDLSKQALQDYARSLYEYRRQNGTPLSFQTQCGYLSRLRAFLRWLAVKRVLLVNLAATMELPRVPYQLPAFLTADEAAKVLAAIDTSFGLGIRNRAIVETLYSTGLRQAELIALDLGDVDLDDRTVLVRQGKGQKDRKVPLGGRAALWIEKYLEDVRPKLVGDPELAAVYLLNSGRRVTPAAMQELIRTALATAGLKKRGSSHLFRHGMASAMLDGGADLRQLQQLLGHESLDTTQRYTHVSIQKLKEVHAQTHPAATLKRRRPPGGPER